MCDIPSLGIGSYALNSAAADQQTALKSAFKHLSEPLVHTQELTHIQMDRDETVVFLFCFFAEGIPETEVFKYQEPR